MTGLDIAIYFFIFVIGISIGSFLNVVALRLLSEEDFIYARSKCPQCGKNLKWYDNIPILSFFLLRGKCRNCGKSISIQYPVVEFFTGVLFVLSYHFWGFSLKTIFFIFLISNLIVITITDLREKVIFDLNSIPLIPLGLVYSFFDIGNRATSSTGFIGISFNDVFISAVIGAIAGAAFFEIFSRIGYLFSGEYAFGGGDTILGAAFGAWFGWKGLVFILVLSLVFQMIVGIPIIVYNFFKSREYYSLFAMLGLFLALLMSIFGRIFNYRGEFLISIILIISAFIIGGISVFVIFSRMRETRNYTFLPFGPPMVAAALLFMFLENKPVLYLPF